MHLYVSEFLEGLVSREKVWEEINEAKKIWENRKGTKFVRASLLPLSTWLPPGESGADSAAFLAMKRESGEVGPVFLFSQS